LTAKGGDLLHRTLDNYHRRAPLETEKLGNGNDGSDMSDDDKMDGDGPRTRAGLRHAPPQRVLYGQQPELKQTRSGYAYNSPIPGQANGFNGAAVSIANYEPRPAPPTMVRPVMTPSNNAQYFRDLARRHKESLRRNRGLVIPKGMMLPGTGYLGTSIYVRCNMALQSGIKDEVKYALHHFTKISFERTDKFLFSGWPNLGETLLRLGCAVSRLWYDHPGWQFSWEDEASDQPTILNELNGTPNIIQKIESFKQLPISTVHSSDWQTDMNIVYQACLVLRNMITIDANAEYLSMTPLVKDLVTILLQLPKAPETIELKYYALDIAESLTKFWKLEAEDGVYLSLIKTVEENIYDRGLVIMGLRALSRISMNLDTPNRLKDVPISLLTHVAQFLLVEDEDLRGAGLDFLYQYTAVTENVQFLVKHVETEALVDTLMQFLMLGAVRITHTSRQDMPPVTPVPAEVSETLPKLAPSIIEKLCQMNDAKDQSTAW
jgi:chromatin structure-remodeling complex subunit RSC9